jgi:hypothetical protein
LRGDERAFAAWRAQPAHVPRRLQKNSANFSRKPNDFQPSAGRVYGCPATFATTPFRGHPAHDSEVTDMKSVTMKSALMLAFSAMPLLAPAQSVPSGRLAEASDVSLASLVPSQRIEGLWEEQVEQVDCHTGMPLRTIGRGTNLFIHGGALIATNNAPPTVMGVTLGQWRYAGGNGNKFRARMRLNPFQPPLETFTGVREIRRDITLSDHGRKLAGVVSTQDYFPEGSPNGNPICARESGTRVASP